MVKSKQERAFEAKLARIAKLAEKLASELFNMTAKAHEYGYAPEQVQAVSNAFDAACRAETKAAQAAEAALLVY